MAFPDRSGMAVSEKHGVAVYGKTVAASGSATCCPDRGVLPQPIFGSSQWGCVVLRHKQTLATMSRDYTSLPIFFTHFRDIAILPSQSKGINTLCHQ